MLLDRGSCLGPRKKLYAAPLSSEETRRADADGLGALVSRLPCVGHPPCRVDWLRAALVVFGSLVIRAVPFVLVGAAAAALIEVFVPIGAFERISSLPRPLRLPAAGLAGVLLPICECGSVIALMMAIASLLSLCSESDAFVGASFTQFGPSAQLAFLVFGPMVDLKLGALYAGSFRRVVVQTIVAVAAVTTLLGSIWIGVLTG